MFLRPQLTSCPLRWLHSTEAKEVSIFSVELGNHQHLQEGSRSPLRDEVGHPCAAVYIQEDPGRPHHLLDSELLHTGLQDYTETSMTPSCSRTRLKKGRRRLGPLIRVTTLQADFLSHCEPVDLQPRPENPYSGHDGYINHPSRVAWQMNKVLSRG
ncbi:Hypothetical predicted protein [Xyrichtys novacula]|uniref:Uncharacterized protein n=1 Tax=Xyrichtys novacula TaxID=13765 RepID=A0AAV1FB96_XYRNO|nr:Hypothetical predicted protein [Xyrichtys novacula]